MSRPPLSRLTALACATTAALVLSLALPAAATAAPPAPATLVAPADGGTTASVTPTLSVSTADADGDSLDVTFEGRERGATVPGDSTADPFTLVVIPDTQNYSYANEAVLDTQLEWVRDSVDDLDTAFVIQVGDLVSEWDDPRHWANVSGAFQILDDAGVPYTVLPGNHDFDTATGDMTVFNSHFPPSRFSGAPWNTAEMRYAGYLGQDQFGPDPIDRGNADNYALFSAGGTDFLLLNLEWEAPGYALNWADRVIDAHPDRTVIMATHSFLTVDGLRMTTPQRPGGTSTASLWHDFVSTHCQIRLVVAGHSTSGDRGEAHRTDDNSCGQPVQQILTDYQSRPNGGDGWLRAYRFDPAADTMTATTYSPSLDRYETDADSAFTLPFELASEPAPFTTIATRTVAAGATASVSWASLEHDTDYEWRAVVDDGTARVASPVWTLRTPPAPQDVIAADAFGRVVASGWGSADVGGPWSITGGSSSLSVTGGVGLASLARGQTRFATLRNVSTTDADATVQLRSDTAATGGAAHATLIGRQVGTSHYGLNVRFEQNGVLRVYLLRDNTAFDTLTSTWTPGQTFTARLATTGTNPTRLTAKIWPSAQPEPTDWQLAGTDTTAAMQTAGTIALKAAVSSSSTVATSRLAFDNLRVLTPGGAAPPDPEPPANQPPTAAFTAVANALVVAADASGSADADGTVASYAWRFGDGGTGTGRTAEHTYAAAGAYTIDLTVTDDDGATASTSRSVTVSQPAEPPAEDVIAADAFGRVIASGWGSADVGGSWTITGSSSSLSVTGDVGLASLTRGQTRFATLSTVSTTEIDATVQLRSDTAATGGAAHATLIGRQVGSSHYGLNVRFEQNGVLRVYLLRDNTAFGTLVSTWSPGQTFTARLAITGKSPTHLAAKIWPSAGSEPTGWQLTATDSTAALQAAGSLALKAAVSSSSTVTTSRLAFDDLRVVTPGP